MIVMWGWLACLALCGCDSLLGLHRLEDAVPPMRADSLDDGLVAWYSFDDATFTDRTGHHHDATCTPPACPTILVGRAGNGNAARFDGIDDRLQVADADELSTPGGFTLAMWINVDAAGTKGSLVSKLFGPACANSWQLHVEMGEVFFFTTTDRLQTPALVAAGTWQYVAARYTGVGEKTVIVDGVEKAASVSATMFDTGKILIGADEDFGMLRTPFTGLIDELRIYNRVLSVDELAALAK
jgi:hypothetical protein